MSSKHILARLAVVAALVPAALHAQAKSCTPIAARPLARGTVLTADDVSQGAATCPLSAALSIVGSVTRRVINVGEPLREPAVAPPNVVESNQKVSVVWRDAGIEVRLIGVAANAAPIGGRVAVRVEGAPRAGEPSRRLEGVAVSPGLVQIR